VVPPSAGEARDLIVQMCAAFNAMLTTRELMLKAGAAIGAALVSLPAVPTENGRRECDPEMHQTKMCNKRALRKERANRR
jgi:transposase, IS5 family